MKLTQIQIIVETYKDEVVIKYYKNGSDKEDKLLLVIKNIIYTQIVPEKEFLVDRIIYKYKKGESRKTIIDTLSRFQETLLPESLYLSRPCSNKIEIRYKDNKSVEFLSGWKIDFYDETNRIITITEFEEFETYKI